MIAPRTLRGRLALWYTLVLAIAIGVFTAIAYFLDADDLADTLHGRESEQETRSILGSLAVALPAALGVAVVGGLYITRRALRPLEDLARLAASLQSSELDERFEVDRGAPEELQRVAASFNQMLARLDASVAAMRRFTADASHELRTPLATTRAELELALRRPRSVEELRDAAGRALAGVGRLTDLTDALLELSQADAAPARPRAFEIVAVTREVVELFRATAAARELRVALHDDGARELVGDPILIERAIVNLIDNACKFAPTGGRVDVGVERAEAAIQVTVENDVVTDVEFDWSRAFERFYRGTAPRAEVRGFGLGLAFVDEVARRHGGSAALERTTAGRARATLRLPTA